MSHGRNAEAEMPARPHSTMDRRRFLQSLGAGAAACALPRLADAGSRQDRPPNFIIIFTDDQGYGDLGCFGRQDIRTPNVDRLAARGTKFTDFYVAAPICTPSRAALLTGCYPRRVGLARGVLRPDDRRGIHPRERTIGEILKDQGYATMAIGKWHVGFLPPFQPAALGFDEYFGIYHNMDHWETRYFEDEGGMPVKHNDEIVDRIQKPDTLTERYTENAVRFIRENRDRPFFLYLAHTMPHVPLGVTDRFRGRSEAGLYGDVIECLDWSTGRLVETLTELGLEENTYVIYTSDNGPSPLADGSSGPLRGRKHTTYEGGLRVPCVMWAPGRVPAGRVCAEVATSMDLLPTLARLSGADIPTDHKIDGRDIRPLILGEPGARSPHKAFFYHNGGGKLRAVREGRWKLHTGKGPELFDLETDIGESKNVASDHPEVVSRLKDRMQKFDRRLAEESRPVGKG